MPIQTMMQRALDGFFGVVKNFLLTFVVLVTSGITIFWWVAPNPSPIDTTQFTSVAFSDGKQGTVFFQAAVRKSRPYQTELILLIDNEHLGVLPLTKGGQKTTNAAFLLPPEAATKDSFEITVHAYINHWTSLIYEQELVYVIETTVINNSGGDYP